MTNYQISDLIQLLEEAKAAFPAVETRRIQAGYLKKLEKRIDNQVMKLSQTPGYQQHLRINDLLVVMEQKGLISLDELTQLYDQQAKGISS